MGFAPGRFRARYGDAMYDVYRSALRQVSGDGRWRAVLWVRGAFVVDVLVTILLEWGAVMGSGTRRWGRVAEWIGLDVRVAVRGFRTRPGFTSVMVLTFTLGIGANAAIFQVFDALLLTPLPYPESDRLVAVWHSLPGRDKAQVGPGTYLDWRERSSTLESLALIDPMSMALTGNGDPVQIEGGRVSANFFDVLGVSQLLGAGFAAADEVPGAGSVAVLSHGVWVRLFGADPDVVGTTITLQGVPTRIAGVAPDGFELDFAGDAELWTVMTFGEAERQLRGTFYSLFGRTRAGVDIGAVEKELNSIFQDVVAAGDAPFAEGWGARVSWLRDEVLGDVGPTLRLLMGAVMLVLLVACANIASLTLARSTRRGGETAVRMALGASRLRISFQRLVETLVIALFGGALGVALGSVATEALLATAPPGLPRLHEVSLDARVLGFAAVLTLGAGLITGLVPVLVRTDAGAAGVLRSGVSRGSRAGTSRTLSLLIVGESALVVLLLVGAGLLMKSFYRLSTVDPGFDAGPALVVGVDLPESRYPDYPSVTAFLSTLEARLEALPMVSGAGVTTHLPTRGGFQLFYEPEGHETASPSDRKLARFEAVSIGYLEALGVHLERGRLFDETDVENGPPSLVINRTMADLLWPGEDPIGKQITLGPTANVVAGVISDIRHQRLDADPEPQFYLPDTQMGFRWSTRDILVRPSAGDVEALIPVVRSTLQNLDPELPTAYVGSMDDVMQEAVADARFRVRLLAILAAVALMLGAVGVYGVVNYVTGFRTREMAIRRALGASAGNVTGKLVSSAFVPLVGGVGLGVVAALGLAPRLGALLFQVDPRDPGVLIGTALFLAAVGLVASVPAASKARGVRLVDALGSD